MADENVPAATVRALDALVKFLEALTRLAGKLETMADEEIKGGRS